jgi:hypothetical protein
MSFAHALQPHHAEPRRGTAQLSEKYLKKRIYKDEPNPTYDP